MTMKAQTVLVVLAALASCDARVISRTSRMPDTSGQRTASSSYASGAARAGEAFARFFTGELSLPAPCLRVP